VIEYTVRVYDNGDKKWFVDGKSHREDGPAIEFASGAKCWYTNGKLNRVDGPAIEWASGAEWWYFDGRMVSEAEHAKLIKPKSEALLRIEAAELELQRAKAAL